MQIKTKAFALSYIKYSEKDIIAKIYTRELGLQSYLVRGVFKQKSKNKIYAFEPFTFLELDVYYKESKQLNYIKELKIHDTNSVINADFIKKSIALMLSEVFIKTVKEEEPNEELFEFIEAAFSFYYAQSSYPEFHLQFLSIFTKFLGVNPINNYHQQEKSFFDIKEGCFVAQKPILHNLYMMPDAAYYFSEYLKSGINNSSKLQNAAQRKQMLFHLINYYKNHVEGFSDLKSLDILTEVLV